MNDLLDQDHLDLPVLTEQVHDAELPELSEPRVVAPALVDAADVPSLHEVVVLPVVEAPPILTDIVEPASLPTVDAQSLPNLLKAAGDGFRLEILRVLAQDSFGVLELCRIFNAKQSGMSHHLKVLTSAGLLSTRREGNSIFYRRSYLVPDSPLASLQQALFAILEFGFRQFLHVWVCQHFLSSFQITLTLLILLKQFHHRRDFRMLPGQLAKLIHIPRRFLASQQATDFILAINQLGKFGGNTGFHGIACRHRNRVRSSQFSGDKGRNYAPKRILTASSQG